MTIPFHQPVVCPILIGRSAELTALQNCLEAATCGQGGVVLLSGEAGIGKSRLVAELRREARTFDFRLLGGQCFPTDRACPNSHPSLLSLPWTLNRSNAASLPSFQTSFCEQRLLNRCCW